jgi:hypothetical protein
LIAPHQASFLHRLLASTELATSWTISRNWSKQNKKRQYRQEGTEEAEDISRQARDSDERATVDMLAMTKSDVMVHNEGATPVHADEEKPCKSVHGHATDNTTQFDDKAVIVSEQHKAPDTQIPNTNQYSPRATATNRKASKRGPRTRNQSQQPAQQESVELLFLPSDFVTSVRLLLYPCVS